MDDKIILKRENDGVEVAKEEPIVIYNKHKPSKIIGFGNSMYKSFVKENRPLENHSVNFIKDYELIGGQFKNFWYKYFSYIAAKFKNKLEIPFFSVPYLIIKVNVSSKPKERSILKDISNIDLRHKIELYYISSIDTG